MRHRTEVRPVEVPAWVLHRPLCTCGWGGDLVRTRALADDQVDEHLAEHDHEVAEQAALFTL